jgi:hypothetical protein
MRSFRTTSEYVVLLGRGIAAALSVVGPLSFSLFVGERELQVESTAQTFENGERWEKKLGRSAGIIKTV